VFLQADGSLCGVVWGFAGSVNNQQSCAVQVNDVRGFYDRVCCDVRIFSPDRRPQQQQAPPPPVQGTPPGQPYAPGAPAPPSLDLGAQLQAHGQQLQQHGQAIAELLQKAGGGASRLETIEAKLAKAAQIAEAFGQALPTLESRLKALEQNPDVQKIPGLVSGLDKTVGVLEKAQPVLAEVNAIKQAVQGAQQQAQGAQQQAQQAQAEVNAVKGHPVLQHGAQILQAVGGGVAAEKAAAPFLPWLGPLATPAAVLAGLGGVAWSLRRNRQTSPAPAPTPAAAPLSPAGAATAAPASMSPLTATLLSAYGPLLARVENNLTQAAAAGIMQSHAGVAGTMGSP